MDVREQIERFPRDPGVYLMKDAAGRIIYVGKAKNLRSRVRQYYSQSGDPRYCEIKMGQIYFSVSLRTRRAKTACDDFGRRYGRDNPTPALPSTAFSGTIRSVYAGEGRGSISRVEHGAHVQRASKRL